MSANVLVRKEIRTIGIVAPLTMYDNGDSDASPKTEAL
jgi:hypothetical protein